MRFGTDMFARRGDEPRTIRLDRHAPTTFSERGRRAGDAHTGPHDDRCCSLGGNGNPTSWRRAARPERYAAAGVRGCWLLRGELPLPARRELPPFALRPGEDDVAVIAQGGESYAVRQFVTSLFNGDVRFREQAMTRLRVAFVDMDCWKCRRPAHI
jgi:hypothetical protein